MITRPSSPTLEQYLQTKKLDELSILGVIDPIKDLIGPHYSTPEAIHFTLRFYPGWGVTFPRIGIALALAREQPAGYFHQHAQERRYLHSVSLTDSPDSQKLIPCFECGKALMTDWLKYKMY